MTKLNRARIVATRPRSLNLAQTMHRAIKCDGDAITRKSEGFSDALALTFCCDMPPTTNNAYFNVKRGGRVMSAEARKFKADAALMAGSEAAKQRWQYAPGKRLALTLTFHFGRGGKIDLSNRVKLLEDAIASALGFDDSVIDQIVLKRGGIAKPPFCQVEIAAMAMQE